MTRGKGRWAALAVLLVASSLSAQAVQYTATVALGEVEVRSGAGDSAQLYATNRVRHGDVVQVVRQVNNEWLAIKPPLGSFSWISMQHVRLGNRDTQDWIVQQHAPVLMGSTLRSEKPTVEAVRVEPGTILRSIGQARQAEDGLWLPIVPPPAEVRYIRAAAVTRNQPGTAPTQTPPATVPQSITNNTTPPSTFSAPQQLSPTVTTGGAAPAPVVSNNPRWVQAQQAEQAGNYNQAIQLYYLCGREVANVDYNLSVQAFNRADWLTKHYNGARPLNPQQRTDVRYPAPVTPAPVVPAPTAPTPGSPSPAPAQPGTLPHGWEVSQPGRLQPMWETIDARKAYQLTSSLCRPLVRVVAGPGVNLDQYLNQNVIIVGPRVKRTDQYGDVMTAMEVRRVQ